jgi:hypothetical protein
MPNRQMAAFRLPTQALADLDRLVEALQRRSVTGRVSKADAIAWALARVLGELDEQDRQAETEAARATRTAGWPRDPLRNRDPEQVRHVYTVYGDPQAKPEPPVRRDPEPPKMRVVHVERSEPEPPKMRTIPVVFKGK